MSKYSDQYIYVFLKCRKLLIFFNQLNRIRQVIAVYYTHFQLKILVYFVYWTTGRIFL